MAGGVFLYVIMNMRLMRPEYLFQEMFFLIKYIITQFKQVLTWQHVHTSGSELACSDEWYHRACTASKSLLHTGDTSPKAESSEGPGEVKMKSN